MRRVVFLYNELLDEDYQKQLKLPLEFVCFAYINGAVMYDIKGKYCALKENKVEVSANVKEAITQYDNLRNIIYNLIISNTLPIVKTRARFADFLKVCPRRFGQCGR